MIRVCMCFSFSQFGIQSHCIPMIIIHYLPYMLQCQDSLIQTSTRYRKLLLCHQRSLKKGYGYNYFFCLLIARRVLIYTFYQRVNVFLILSMLRLCILPLRIGVTSKLYKLPSTYMYKVTRNTYLLRIKKGSRVDFKVHTFCF